MSIGERIKAFRKAKGMDQLTLARLSGVSQGGLSMIEKGDTEKPQVDTLQRIAEALAVSLIELTDDVSQSSAGGSLDWFWRKAFALMGPGYKLRYRHAPVKERMTWSMRQLVEAFPPEEIAAKISQPVPHVLNMAAGEVEATPALMDLLVGHCSVPENWLLNGDVGPTDPALKKLLQHRDAGTYLDVIGKAIDEGILPELLMRALDLLLGVKNAEKAPTE